MIKKLVPAAAAAFAMFASAPALAGGAHADPAPGQSKADYYAWLAQSPKNIEAVRSFRTFLEQRQVADVVPVWQLTRTSSSWRQCSADRFEVAPAAQWANIVDTLGFVKNEVEPAIGEVEALSVFRNERLNSCSSGAPRSAHRMFFAMDMVPADAATDRKDMIGRICTAHAQRGSAYRAGLGFYSGVRFHVDSNGFRKWGSDGRGASSPCNARIA